MTKDVIIAEDETPDSDRIKNAVAVVVAREGDAISPFLNQENDGVEPDPGATYAAIITEIMASESVGDVLNLPEAEKLETYVGRTIRIHGFSVNDSEFETGPPVYFTVKGYEVDSGERVIINTGEQKVMAQLMRLHMFGAFPIDATVVAAKRPNRYGRMPLALQAPKG